nr:zinc finger protein 676-like [Aedes albopictus]
MQYDTKQTMNPSDLERKICFICREGSTNFLTEVNTGQSVGYIIRQHFWFQEHELWNASICGTCWERVDQFHRFYEEVKDRHEKLKLQGPLVFIKQEEVHIDEDLEQDPVAEENVAAVSKFKPSSSVSLEDCGGQLSNVSQNEPSMEQRRPWKHSKIRKTLTPEERQAQDEVIKQHMRYFCEECNLEFDSFCVTVRHQINVHDQTYITCCDRQYKTRSMLYEHALNPGDFRCEFCGKTFKLIHGYHRHKKQFHKDEKELLFKCHLCSESFAQESMLRRHMVEHDPTKCQVCGKEFSNKYGLMRHTKDFHEEHKEYVCDVCSKGFYRHAMYLEHRKTHDLTPEQLREQCPVCSKWLKNHECWEKHVKRHQTEGAFICDICDHVSVNSMSLRVHKVRQHGPKSKRHVCDLCGKEYSRPATLKEHVSNAHTGEPLYQCQYCLKKFFSSATMYAHRKKDHPKEWLKDHMTKYGSREEGTTSDAGDSSQVA